jgi:hypothetical protein
MISVPSFGARPTNLAPLPRLLAYAQGLGLERHLFRAKRGIPTLALALIWLVLAWRGTGRPERLDRLDEPLLAALLGLERRPTARTLLRSVSSFSAHGVRRAVEASYAAELPRRSGRVWVALDAHQLPYWGRGKPERFEKGRSGSHSRRLRGYRLYLAVDADTGQVITSLLARGGAGDDRLLAVLARRVRSLLGPRLAGVVADSGFTSRAATAALLDAKIPFILGFARSAPLRARLATLSGQQRRWLRDGGAIRLGTCTWDPRLRLFAIGARSPTDTRGPWVYVTSLRSWGPNRLASTYRRRWRVEQAIEELLNGMDLDHLVGHRLPPNRVAIGSRLLARNLAIGLQVRDAMEMPAPPLSASRPPSAPSTSTASAPSPATTETRAPSSCTITTPPAPPSTPYPGLLASSASSPDALLSDLR